MLGPVGRATGKTITNVIPSITNLKNIWWSLPSILQDKIKLLVPDKDTWSLKVKKIDTGEWVFSIPQFLTINESLTGGTELVIDYYGEQVLGYVPCIGEQLIITVSKKPLEDETLQLGWIGSDPNWPESNNYQDPDTGLVSWLCPYLQVLFKEVPPVLYVNVSPVP